jgi:mannose-6-phosphate isomerase-like protein (cupin superfamily)
MVGTGRVSRRHPAGVVSRTVWRMHILADAGRFTPGGTRHWVEHLRVEALSVGTYSLPAGGTDTQSPHTEDEIYVVTAGRARFVAGSASLDVGPGAVLYVPAGEEHRFVDITEDLAVLVVFAPAEHARAGSEV